MSRVGSGCFRLRRAGGRGSSLAPFPAEAQPRAGFALPAALLALLVLSFSSLAALHLALYEGVVVRTDERLLRSRMAAEAGVREAVSELSTLSGTQGSDWPEGWEVEGSVGGGADYRVGLHPVDVEHALLDAEGRGREDGRGKHHVGRLLWRPDPDRRLERLEAILVHGGAFRSYDGSGIEADPVSDPGWLEPGHIGGEECDPYRDRVHRALDGRSPSLRHRLARSPERVSLGRRSGPGFRGVVETGEVVPLEGAESGADAPNGEGEPALWVAEEDTAVPDGAFEGIIWVDGDLELRGGAVMTGLLLVDGTLSMTDGAEVVGHARVRDDVELDGEAAITGSGCALLAALEGVRGALRPSPLPSGSWISLPRP